MARTFTDNPDKSTVRALWNTPLLRHLNSQYGIRYRYLGLPGTDLIDVNLWKDMIDEVIAFEPPDADDGGKRAYNALTYNMRKAGIPGHVYCGSFEEVVLLRTDFEGQGYTQEKVVTLYNLDFCNEICSQVQTQEHGKRVWRFDAIRQVLRDQSECFRSVGGPRHFILMITVRNQIGARKIRDYLSPSRLQGDARAFYRKCSAINSLPESGAVIGTHSRALKALLHNMLCSYFGNPNLSALFFPQVLYQGTKVRTSAGFIDSPMLHWLVLCRFGEDTAPTPEFWPNEYLVKPSVMVGANNSLVWGAQTGEDGPDNAAPDTVGWLSQHGASILNGIGRLN